MKNDPKLIQDWLKQKKRQQLYRTHRVTESPQQALMRIDGKALLNFSSNDYLGLANHPDIIASFKAATDIYGVGSGSAHLISGHSKAHRELEEYLAYFTGRERALLFSTGYMANIGVLNALTERGDTIYADRLNHASLVDGALLSRATTKRYQHNDMPSLERQIQRQPKGNGLIVSDGVFSMDGDIANVNTLAEIAKNNQAWLMIDDAHGFGVLGETGGGVLQQQRLSQDDTPILMATLGKAVGTAGAFIAGSEELIEYLIQTARSHIFTTAMPAAIAAATLTSLKIIRKENGRREKLQALIKQFKQGAREQGIKLMSSDTAIQPIMVESSENAVAISQQLLTKGLLVSAIRPPTVPLNTARLRITLSSDHSEAMINTLLLSLRASPYTQV
ncbi:MAG: 8-amino-7-oxononanoate synthase, partial [Cocleimonas sp.]|nr:8-amino-7-oxononanoate synthase [Cocleimonas sp.]